MTTFSNSDAIMLLRCQQSSINDMLDVGFNIHLTEKLRILQFDASNVLLQFNSHLIMFFLYIQETGKLVARTGGI
jgi:hypothetical protein